MTIIAAMTTDHGVIMGSDVAADYSGTVIMRHSSKVIVLTANNDRILIGGAGNSALVPTIRRHLKIERTPPPLADLDSADAWASAIAESITDILANTTPPLLCSTNDAANTLDGSLLLAWRTHLWYVFTHTAFRPFGPVAAIGSGTDAALGSMYTSIHHHAEPSDVVSHAINLASRIDTGCRVDERGPLMFTTT